MSEAIAFLGSQDYYKFRDVDVVEWARVIIMSRKVVPISSAMTRLCDYVLARGVRIQSEILDKRFGIKRKKNKEKKKKEKIMDLDIHVDTSLASLEESDTDLEDSKEEKKNADKEKKTKKRKFEHTEDDKEEEEDDVRMSSEQLIARSKLRSFENVICECLRATMWDLLCFGFTAFQKQKHASFGDMPMALKLEDYSVKFQIHRDNKYELLYFNENSTDEIVCSRKPTAVDDQWIEAGPSKDGHLRSPLADIIPQTVDMMCLIRAAAASEYHFAYPTLISTSNNTTKGPTCAEPLPVNRATTTIPQEVRDSLAYSASYDEAKRNARRHNLEMESAATVFNFSKKSLTDTHTRMVPSEMDWFDWNYNLQDGSSLNGTLSTVRTVATSAGVADYEHMLSELVLEKLGMPVDKSGGSKGGGGGGAKGNMFKSKQSSSSASQSTSPSQDPTLANTMNKWGDKLSQLAEYLLVQFCKIDDARVSLPATIDTSAATHMLETGCVKMTEQLAERLADAFNLPQDCFVDCADQTNKAEEMKLQLEEKKLQMQMEMKMVELKFKQEEMKMKVQEAELKMKLEEKRAASQAAIQTQKAACDISNKNAKTHADIQNKKAVSSAQAKRVASKSNSSN